MQILNWEELSSYGNSMGLNNYYNYNWENLNDSSMFREQ